MSALIAEHSGMPAVSRKSVQQFLSKETCRIKAKAPFSVLVEMVGAYFKEQKPDLAWIG